MVAIEASAAPRVRRAAELVQYMQQRGYTARYTGKHAIGEGMPLLMVHEQRDGKGAVPFGQIIAGTPPPLRHIYDGQLASPLYDGDELQRVCLRVLLRTLAVPRRRPREDERAPALLEMRSNV